MKKLLTLAIVSAIFLTACEKAPDYDATGIFEATVVTVSAQNAGIIEHFFPQEGDTVTETSLLAQINTSLQGMELKQVQSQRQSAEASSPDISAQTSALRAQITHQQNECQRISRLVADGAATRKQADDAEAALATLKAQLAALLSGLDKSKASIADNADALTWRERLILEQIERGAVRSPISGTILTKLAEAGEYATPGRPLCRIANLNDIYLRAYFTASQLADISVGRSVTVIADFGDARRFEYPGTITWIAEESEFTPKSIQTPDSRANLVYAVKIRVSNDGRLKLGQYGEVKL